MRVSPKDKPARNGNAGPTGPGKPKPGVNQTQTDAAKVLSFEHKAPSTTGVVLPLQPSTPPSNAQQQVAAYEPWGWKTIVMPHLGAKAHQRYVHFSEGNISVSEQQGAGLRDKATYECFCQSVVTEIMRGHFASGTPPQARLNLHQAAIMYSHVLAAHILNRDGPHVTVSSFMAAVAKELKMVSGQSIDVLHRRCTELNDANPRGQKAAYLGVKEAMGDSAIDTATVFLNGTRHAIAWVALREKLTDLKAPKPFGIDKLTDMISGLVVGKWDAIEGFDMLRALRTDAALSAALLEHTGWLVDTVRDADQENAVMPIYTETAAAGLILSLSPELLDQLTLEVDDVDWLQRQICLLLGYIAEMVRTESPVAKEFLGTSSVCAGPSLHELTTSMDRIQIAQLLVEFGERYMKETSQGKIIANRLLEPIPMLRHNAQRRAALAQVEERLREAFPDEDVNFEGERIDELLTFFSPQVAARGGAITWHSLQSTPPLLAIAPVGPTPSTTSLTSAASLTVAAHAPTDVLSDAQQGHEEFSMDLLRSQWQRFKELKAQRARPVQTAPKPQAQPQPDAATPAESKETTPMGAPAGRRSGKQPGSQPEHSGYEHKHPKNMRALPALVRKSRIAAMTNRPQKYTANDRVHYRETKHKRRGDVHVHVQQVD